MYVSSVRCHLTLAEWLHYSYCYGYLVNTCQHIGESVYYLTSKELQQKVLWSFLVLFDVEKNGI